MLSMKEVFKRIVFVLYIAGFILGTVIVGYLGWSSKPYQEVDPVKSIVACNNGIKFTLADIDVIPRYPKRSYEDKKTNKVSLETWNNQKIYDTCGIEGVKSLGLEDKTIGSWSSVLKTWIGSFGILCIILEVIKGTIFYIVFGNWQGTYKNKG